MIERDKKDVTLSEGRSLFHEVNTKEKKRKRVIRIVVVTAIIIILLMLLHRCGYLGKRDPEILVGAGIKQGELTKKGDKKPKSNGKSEMTVRMNGYPVFADGNSPGNLNIENPDANELYMNVEITLNSTGETIYNSGAIPPNHYIDSDKLEVVLPKGKHEAVARVTLLDPDNPDSHYNSANFKMMITIEN